MANTPIQNGRSILRPRARIIKTIGEELISNDIVAIIELVKNCYDANATIIDIRFQGRVIEVKEGKKIKRVLIRQGSSISIIDDGIGMDLDVVKNAWMEPATIMKKNISRGLGSKRRYTGEKGIGRFASAKLATSLKMTTRTNNDNEIIVDFNWNDFMDDNKYLDQVECSWEVKEPVEINKTGTKLILTDLNSDWDEEKFRELRVALSRFINPISPVEDFLMDLQLPKELNDLSGWITPPESLSRPNYTIKGSINDQGISDITYNSRKNDKIEQVQIKPNQLRPIRKPVVGPFSFEFRVWNREPENLKNLAFEMDSTIKNIKGDLDNLAGISIYRDNIRVLPYGEKKNDWLRLDIRRVNNPTKNLSNNQIVGYISISLDNNPDLKDQSNREGLVESQALLDLKEFIILILNELEIRRYEERPRETEEDENRKGLFNSFSIDPLTQLIQTRLPNDKEANDIIAKTESSLKEGVKKIQEVLSRYRRLSTLGLLIDVILHDGNNFIARIDSELHLLKKSVSKKEIDTEELIARIKNIDEERKVLSQIFKRIEPFGGRKRGRPKEIIIEDAIENVFALFANELTKLDIRYFLPKTQNVVKIDESELQMIFVNLLQNSMYWLETTTGIRKIEVIVEKSENQLSVIFSDNGPGIKEEHHNIIFDPYFSTKPDGIGLGLTIIGELVTEYDGEFCLINNPSFEGASFKITFRKRI